MKICFLRFCRGLLRQLNAAGEAVFLKGDDRLCLINTKVMMLREGRVFFYACDEELFKSQDPYIRDFLLYR
jgi:ABC-type transporter Mla maintaining outer membrane lipid asymmetry ATPase subunit MlaF